MARDLAAVSRALNAALGGDPAEMLCSRLYRNRYRYPGVLWATVGIDFYFLMSRGELGHCRQRHAEHSVEQDRARGLVGSCSIEPYAEPWPRRSAAG